jgi:hypothetical protein
MFIKLLENLKRRDRDHLVDQSIDNIKICLQSESMTQDRLLWESFTFHKILELLSSSLTVNSFEVTFHFIVSLFILH